MPPPPVTDSSAVPSCLRSSGSSRVAPTQRGVTSLELMIVLSVIGILVGSAIPTFVHVLSMHRAATVTNDLVQAMMTTRSEALKRGRRVYLAPPTGRWQDGWVVFVDRNDDRTFDAAVDEVVTRHDALPGSIAVTGPSSPAREPFTDVGSPRRAYVMFDGSGYPRQRNGGLGIGSFTVTDRSGGAATVRTICLAAYGRVRVVQDHAAC